MIRTALTVFGLACLFFTVVQSAVLLIYGSLSGGLMRERRPGRRPLALAKAATDPATPGVSIVMPAYNEENVIIDTVVGALAQEYPRVEVIVVNDGSKDATLQVLIDHFGLVLYEEHPPPGPIATQPVRAVYRSPHEPRVVVIDKVPSGAKADGSNAGINAASYPWVVVMDADELMERDTIARCMAEVAQTPETIVAVGGTLLPSNDLVIDGPNIVERRTPRNYWVGCQLIEYLTAFLVARPGLARLGAVPIVSGGFGLFRRDAVIAVDGYRHGHLAEDMDLCLRLQRFHADREQAHRVAQVPESLCWTEFPSTRVVLRRQRIRWHRGLRSIVEDHSSMIGRRRYGSVGSLGVGSLLMFEWIGPLLEVIGWAVLLVMVMLGWATPSGVTAVFLVTQLFGMVMSMLGVAMMTRHVRVYQSLGDLGRLFGYAVAFNWGYRQITLAWRIRSLFGGSTEWGEMPRVGFRSVSPAGSPTT